MPSSQHIMREYHRQQFRVGGAEVEGGHLGGGVPAEGFVLERGWLGAWRGLAVDKRQMDRAVGVGMRNRRAYAGIHNLKRDLLAAFAGKRLAGRFARLDLSADELPVSAKRLSDWPPPEKILVLSANDAAYDFYDFSFHGLTPSLYHIFALVCRRAFPFLAC